MLKVSLTHFYRRLVLESFHQARRGTLRMTMPGGACRIFGGLDKELHADITIKEDAFYRRWVLHGLLGFAESYLYGEWETQHLPRAIAWFFLNSDFLLGGASQKSRKERYDLFNILNRTPSILRFYHSKKIQKESCLQETLGPDFFKPWLDPSMTFSAAYYQLPEDSLAEAQQAQWKHLCEKLRLTPYDHLLDLQCGYGSFAIYAAKHYGCRVQAATSCEEQLREAALQIEKAGLSHLIKVVLADYKDIGGRFDKIAGTEVLSTVGEPCIEAFFATMENILAPHGILVLQMVLCPDNQYPFLRDGVDFIQKYIAPETLPMSLRRITEACSSASELNLLECEDVTPSYARTALAWREAFTRALPELRSKKYSPFLLRKWFYYLCHCEASFGTRSRSLLQALYTRPHNLELTSPLYSL